MPAHGYRLVIGNKATSSWSLRPWLAMKHLGIPFEEVQINLRAPDKREQIIMHSAAGKVPVLWDGDHVIWDSLAILEYLAEKYPGLGFWPRERIARAVARSAAAEMHSGFQALREHCPMAFLEQMPKDDVNETVQHNIRRVVALWIECRGRFGEKGPFLFSDFSIADAMYAPVASRLRTYIPDLTRFGDDGTAQAYIDALFALPAMAEWARGARDELAFAKAT